eukprot:8874217-Pyramimonas_sp.AAC.2
MAKHGNDLDSGNIIDAAWVRRWKKMYDENNNMYYIIKSRLCGRGFLDSQKNDFMRHSSTASRLSQRMVASLFSIERGHLDGYLGHLDGVLARLELPGPEEVRGSARHRNQAGMKGTCGDTFGTTRSDTYRRQ